MPTFSRQPYRTVITHRLRAEVAAKLASHTYVLLNREDRSDETDSAKAVE